MLKIKNKLFLGFLVIYILIYYIHNYYLNLHNISEYDVRLIQTYALNGFFVYLLFIIIHFFLDRTKKYIGFIFISFSILKFLLFFVLIFPVYKIDDHISRTEILAFFIPYSISLFFEISYLGKLLNNLKF